MKRRWADGLEQEGKGRGHAGLVAVPWRGQNG